MPKPKENHTPKMKPSFYTVRSDTAHVLKTKMTPLTASVVLKSGLPPTFQMPIMLGLKRVYPKVSVGLDFLGKAVLFKNQL